MTRRILLAAHLAALLSCFGLRTACSSPAEDRPNFLVIITDQWNPNVFGYAGHPVVQTPHIDALAASGMNFTRMYVTEPLCMPSRATLFTGLTPRGHRVRMNGISLDPAIPTFTDALRRSGYLTHCAGKIHLGGSTVPAGRKAEALDPAEFPENAQLWLSARITRLPLPFYGLESVDYLNGHGHHSYGDYVNWLKRLHPKAAKLFFDKTPLEPPTGASTLYNRESYKWALPADLHPSKWVADRTIDFLRSAAATQKERGASAKPFFLFCGFADPHPPFAPPAPYCYKYKPDDVPPAAVRQGEFDDLPPHFRQMYETPLVTSGNKLQSMKDTVPFRAECTAHYFGLCEMVDDQVGRILGVLRDEQLAINTVVVFTADHGEALGDHGMWGKGPYHFDSVIRVPFIVRWPSRTKPGSKYEDVVSEVDFAPTILDMAGVPIPTGDRSIQPEAPDAPPPWPGRTLVPILTGRAPAESGSALVEEDEDYLGLKLRTLVTKRYRLTVYSGQSYGELFDLKTDPKELHNLWNDPALSKVKQQLTEELLQKIIQTDFSLPRQRSRS